MSAPSNVFGSHAIVIGGGMAGLLSAHVLTNYFESVSLIERDSYPEEPIARAGVPQGKHVYILLVRGQQILEKLFPGIKDKLVARGAIESDFAADYGYYFPSSGWTPRAPSSLKGYVCTRPLLEWQVRQEVMARKRVQVIEKHEVVNLLATASDYHVPGIEGMNPTWVEKLTYRYFDNIVKLLPTTPSVSKTFTEVLHMIEPPTALFHPAIVARVLLLLCQTSFNRATPS